MAKYFLAFFGLISFIYLNSVWVQLEGYADDPGVGWHLESGEWMIAHNTLPQYDPFLSSETPRTWISDQWLSDLLLFKGYQIAGFPLLYALGVGIFLLTFAGLLFTSALSLGAQPVSAAIASAIAFKLSTIHLILRPVLFSFILFATLFSFLLKQEREDVDGESSNSIFQSIFIFLLFLLWVNLHPSFVLGLGLIGLTIGSHIVDKFFLGTEKTSEALNKKILLLGSAFLGTVINPYGLELHQSIMTLGESSYFMNLHNEWKPLDVRTDAGHLFLFLIASFTLLAAFRKNIFEKIPSFLIFCFTIFLILGLYSVRFVPYFAMVSIPLFAMFLSPKKHISHSPELLLFAGSSVIAFGIFFITGLTGVLPAFSLAYGPSTEKFPYNGVKTIQTIDRGSSIPVLAHPNWGGFITWKSNQNLKPVLDDRNTLVGEEFHKEVFAALQSPVSSVAYAKTHGIPFIILPKKIVDAHHEPITEARIVSEDSVATTYQIVR